MDMQQELLKLKVKTGWSWERMSLEFERVMKQPGPSHTTLFRYATGKARPASQIYTRYVSRAIQRVMRELPPT